MEELPTAVQTFIATAGPIIAGVIWAIIIFVVGLVVAGVADSSVKNMAKKAGVDEALYKFFGQIARYLVLTFAVIAALNSVGVETTAIAGVVAAAGFAVGMALQGNLGNFASGVMILFFKPFTIGDRITAGGHTGGVTDIGLFATTMYVPSNEKIIVPNGSITGGSIVNHTAEPVWRDSIAIGVAYGADMDQVMDVLKKAAASADKVLDGSHDSVAEDPAVAFVNFGASSLDFLVHCWCLKDDWLDMQHNVKVAIYNALNEAGIDIPFDQVVVHQATTA